MLHFGFAVGMGVGIGGGAPYAGTAAVGGGTGLGAGIGGPPYFVTAAPLSSTSPVSGFAGRSGSFCDAVLLVFVFAESFEISGDDSSLHPAIVIAAASASAPARES